MTTDPQQGSPLPPAGWYPDPAAPGRLRWWDGSAWSAEQSPAGSTSQPEQAGPASELPVRGVPLDGPAGGPSAVTETLPPAGGAPGALPGTIPSGPPGAAPGAVAGGGAAPGPARNTQALLALIAGIVAIFLNPLLLVGIAAIVLGVLGLRRVSREGIEGKGRALTGIILGAVATVLWIVLAIVLAVTLTTLRTPAGSPGASPPGPPAGPSEAPSAAPSTPTESDPPPAGELACWDGTESDEASGCPALVGLDALKWVFTVDSVQTAECAEVTDPFEPAGAEEIYLCTWPDLPGSEVYLTRYSEPAPAVQDLWRDYMSSYEQFTESELLDLHGDPILELDGTDSGEIAATEYVLSYAEAPFVLDVWTDLVNATPEQHSEALSRIQFEDVDGVVEALEAVR